jgi:uncharacterized RDD family membrane protein YckC
MPQTSKVSSGGWYKATILRRFFAVFIDGVIIGGASFVITLFVPKDSQMYSLMQPLLTLGGWVYAVFFIWQSGATPGKSAMGIKVVRTDGSKLSLWQAILREVIGKFVSGLVFMLGYLWVLWDKNRQAWHDHIAGTYVVTKIPNDGKNPGCLIMLIIGAVAFIPLVAIIAAITVLAINPLELTRQSRDTVRMVAAAEITNAQTAILSSNPEVDYCNGSAPCGGLSTDPNAEMLNGSGWVKTVLPTTSFTEGHLPIDPVNDQTYFYKYCSDGKNWEMDFRLESKKYEAKLLEDKGDSDTLYEVGSDLTLCK